MSSVVQSETASESRDRSELVYCKALLYASTLSIPSIPLYFYNPILLYLYLYRRSHCT